MCDYKNAYRARIDESSYLLNCVHDLLFQFTYIVKYQTDIWHP